MIALKRIFMVFMCLLVVSYSCSIAAMADSQEIEIQSGLLISETVEYFEDGSKIVTSIYDETANIDGDLATAATTFTKSGSKTKKGYNSDNEVMWSFTIRGTFSVVSGTSATCTATSYSYTVPGSGWSLKTASSNKSANKAIGTATFVKKVLGITTQTSNTSVTLTCSTSGVLS